MINGLALCDLHVDRVEGGYIDTSNPKEYRVKATSRDGKVTLSAGKPKPNIDRFNLCFFTGTIFIEKNTTFIIKNRGLPILLPWTGLYGFDRETSVFLLDDITPFNTEQWILNWNPKGLDKINLEFYNKLIKNNPYKNGTPNNFGIFLLMSGIDNIKKLLRFLKRDLIIGQDFSIRKILILSKKGYKINLAFCLNLFIYNSIIYLNEISQNIRDSENFGKYLINSLKNININKSNIYINKITNNNSLFTFGSSNQNMFNLNKSIIKFNFKNTSAGTFIIFGTILNISNSKIIVKKQTTQQNILVLTKIKIGETSQISIKGIKLGRNMKSNNLLIPSISLTPNNNLYGASGITIAKGGSLINKGTIKLQGDNICPTILNQGTLEEGTIITKKCK